MSSAAKSTAPPSGPGSGPRSGREADRERAPGASPEASSAGPLARRLLRELRDVVGEAAVIADPERLLAYESDGLTQYRHRPAAVVLPADTDEVARVLSLLHATGLPVVPRGAGTGLSGGCLAVEGGVVVGTSRMHRILDVRPDDRTARVQAGVINARLSAATRPHGLHYAPDPSSQSACTLGGNVAENSGGPHCLKYGVTSRYVTGLTLVLPDGEVVELGGAWREPAGYDLVGAVVGSEGCFGVVTEIEVALLPVPEDVRTVLAIFDDVEDAGRAVTRIIASGLLPAALEMIDGETIRAVEASVFAAGYPTDAGAALVIEFDGIGAGLDEEAAAAEEACRREGARELRRASDEEERSRLWKGRKKAFGAMGRIAPDLLVQDATVPRSRLPGVLARIAEIADEHGLRVANVFHAGDGNLHPNILFDRRDEATVERVERASREIMEVCVEAGGTITGEHGVGLDKRAYMPLVHGPAELAQMAAVKACFDPDGRLNPGKVLPDGVRPAGEADPTGEAERGVRGIPPSGGRRNREAEALGVVEEILGADALVEIPGEYGAGPRSDGGESPPVVAAPGSTEAVARLLAEASARGLRVAPAGNGRHPRGAAWEPVDLVVTTRRMDSIEAYEPADLTLTAGAGIGLRRVAEVTGSEEQWLPLGHAHPDYLCGAEGTLGGALSSGVAGPLATRYGAPRDLTLGLTLVTGDGRILRLGGRVVKNVAGFDLVRLVVGARGTLGVVTEATVRLYPRPKGVVRLEARAGRAEELVAAARAVATASVLPAAVELTEWGAPMEREARLGVVLHGPEAAVEEEANRLAAATPDLERVDIEHRAAPERPAGAGPAGAGPDGEGRDGGGPPGDGRVGGGGGLGVALRLPPSELADLVSLTRRLGRLDGGRDVLEGVRTVLRVDPSAGRLRITVPNLRIDGASAGPWAERLTDLGATLERRGGGLRVERAPAAIARLTSLSGSPSPGEATLMRRLRARFDPDGILAPGRFHL